MKKNTVNNTKLGLFVLAGLLVLVILLYMIGRNREFFGSSFVIKAHFQNVQGLASGNNVRYGGIEIGTVSKVKILNDTLIEVSMIVDNDMKQYIRKNAVASIGTEGFIGNKVVNIAPGREAAALIDEGDIIAVQESVDTDQMLQTLGETSNDIAVLVQGLKTTIDRINKSDALWDLMSDKNLPASLRASAANLHVTTTRAAQTTRDIQSLVADIKSGKGSLGMLLTDTAVSGNLEMALEKLNRVGSEAEQLVQTMNAVATEVQSDLNNGSGPLNTLLKDSSMVIKITETIDNLQKGTESFNENMEALKQNFLFRRYFRRMERAKKNE
jgi:phospholipid/cholesterol/gamma-HCH transport system substrate-binding protein